MNRRSLALLCLACTALAAGMSLPLAHAATSRAAARTPSKTKPAKTARPAGGSGGTTSPAARAERPAAVSGAGTLPDSAMLARVNDRLIRVKDFNESYFNSDPQYRPAQDSLGRVEFLNSMINKEVMGLTALATSPPLSFEDRSTLREHTNRVLSNVLYARMVIDSVKITEEDILKTYEQFKQEVHLKHIQLPTRAQAEQVRRELAAKRIAWSVAVRKYSAAEDRARDGDMGWRARLGVDAMTASFVWDLKPGEISDVLEDPQGYHVVMMAERRPSVAPALEPLRGVIRDQILGLRAGERQRKIQQQLLAGLDVVPDEANIAWASTKFERSVKMTSQGGAPQIDIDPNVPEFQDSDRERVLARYKGGGSVKLDQLIHNYESMPPMLRPPMDTPAALKDQVNALILEPTMIQLAHDRGIDKDPEAVALISKKREQLLVEHLYQDSIQAHVRVTPQMRRKYYEDHKPGFFTYPKVRFAAIGTHSRAGADSLKARLAKGEKAEAILLADSLAGIRRGSIQERYQNEHGPYQKVLFEELRPGQTTVDGPDKTGDYIVLQVLAFDPGHQLKYEEVERMVDESVQNVVADQMFKAFVARHRKQYRVESHPELVMRIRIQNPL